MRWLLLACGLVFGCRSAGAPPPPVSIPITSEITAIEVTPNRGDDRATKVIDEPQRIADFVAFINERGDNWQVPPTTFPSGEFTVAVKSREDLVAVFWPTRGHLGGRGRGEGADANRLRPLNEVEWETLCQILAINAEPRP
jgi:hypothetical protein